MRPNRHFGILSCVVLAATAALGSTAALAGEPTTAQSLRVTYMQADLQNAESAEKLYKRLRRAARMVCEQPTAREVERYREFKSCFDRALDNAVTNVGATALTAVHRNHSRTQAAG
jgi:UrcA family protein